MIKTIVVALLAAIMSATAQASAGEKYPVSPHAWEIKTYRVGDVLFRYVMFSAIGYPCLRLETFEPISQKPIDRKEVCRIRTGERTIDVRSDVSGAYFENPRVEDGTFRFVADIVMRGAGSYYLGCKVVISGKGKLTEPACQEEERPPEPDDKK